MDDDVGEWWMVQMGDQMEMVMVNINREKWWCMGVTMEVVRMVVEGTTWHTSGTCRVSVEVMNKCCHCCQAVVCFLHATCITTALHSVTKAHMLNMLTIIPHQDVKTLNSNSKLSLLLYRWGKANLAYHTHYIPVIVGLPRCYKPLHHRQWAQRRKLAISVVSSWEKLLE